MASLKSTLFFSESAGCINICLYQPGASTFACKTALFPSFPFQFSFLYLSFFFHVPFVSCFFCFSLLFLFLSVFLSFSFPFPFLFFLSFFFLFLCFSVPFPSLPLHFLSFPPRAQVYHRCEHFTESTLKEYYSQHSKWGIAIWEGPIANLSFFAFSENQCPANTYPSIREF